MPQLRINPNCSIYQGIFKSSSLSLSKCILRSLCFQCQDMSKLCSSFSLSLYIVILYFSLPLQFTQVHTQRASANIAHGALQQKQVKACICQIVKQICLLPFIHCLYCFLISKHNSLPLGQIRAFISHKLPRSPHNQSVEVWICLVSTLYSEFSNTLDGSITVWLVWEQLLYLLHTNNSIFFMLKS